MIRCIALTLGLGVAAMTLEPRTAPSSMAGEMNPSVVSAAASRLAGHATLRTKNRSGYIVASS